MRLNDYRSLLEKLSIKELEKYFTQVMNELLSHQISQNEFLKILIELTDRQGYTYEILNKSIRTQVDDLVISCWNSESFDTIDDITFIMINLGLEKTFNLCKQKIANNDIKDGEIKDEIISVIQEIGNQDISNPYRSLS